MGELIRREHRSGENYTLSTLFTTLHSIITEEEAIFAMESHCSESNGYSNARVNYVNTESLSQAKTFGNLPKGFCLFCSGSHNTEDCTRVTSIEDRRKTTRMQGRCYLCLQTDHQAANCTAEYCSNCSQRHSKLLCPQIYNGKSRAHSQVRFESSSRDRSRSASRPYHGGGQERGRPTTRTRDQTPGAVPSNTEVTSQLNITPPPKPEQMVAHNYAVACGLITSPDLESDDEFQEC